MKKNDLIFLIIVSVCCIALLLSHVFLKGGQGDTVVITVDGDVYGTYPLNREQTIEIRPQAGGLNILKIAGGKADMTEADCPDRLCVHQLSISKDREAIVCLPHKIVVTVKSAQTPELDAVAD